MDWDWGSAILRKGVRGLGGSFGMKLEGGEELGNGLMRVSSDSFLFIWARLA